MTSRGKRAKRRLLLRPGNNSLSRDLSGMWSDGPAAADYCLTGVAQEGRDGQEKDGQHSLNPRDGRGWRGALAVEGLGREPIQTGGAHTHSLCWN